MKKLILVNFVLGCLILSIPSAKASYIAPKAQNAHERPVTTLNEQIYQYAIKYGVKPRIMYQVIDCESNYNPKAVGDGGKSYGLVQIHLPSHPSISKTQALDSEYSIEFLAKNLAHGKGNMWTCYKNMVN